MTPNPIAVGLLAVVFGLVIVRQLSGRGPPIWVTFGVGAITTLGLGLVSPSGVVAVVESSAAPVVLFLFALFLFATALERSGALDHLAHWLIGRAATPDRLPFVLFVGFGLASAVVVNDALVLVGVPLLFSVARRLRVDPKPLLLVLAFAVTVGSALTPLGNPQNLLVSISSGLSAPIVVFLEYLLAPTIAGLLLGGAYLRWIFRGSLASANDDHARLRASAPALLPRGGWTSRLAAHPVLAIFPALLAGLLGLELYGSFTGAATPAIWLVSLAAAAILLSVSPNRRRLLGGVETTILLLFIGLFVVVQGAVDGGVIAGLESFLPISGPGGPTTALWSIAGLSVGGSQLVSNVPWVALQIPVLTGLGYSGATPLPWLALAASSTLAGNVTLLGAASNLIVVERAEHLGVRIRLSEFVRYGLPIAAVTVVLTVAFLTVGL